MYTKDDLVDAINFYDTNGDRKIDIDQVGLTLRAVGLVPTESQLTKLTCNFPQESRLGMEELVPIAREVSDKGQSRDLSLCLTPFDRDSSGYISLAELRHLLLNCGDKLKAAEVDILLHGIDITDGKVNIANFIKHITSL